MMKKMIEGLEAFLRRRGYVHADVRELARNQVVLCAAVLVLCAVLFPAASWTAAFAAGAVLITVNFLSLAKFGQRIVGYSNRREAILASLFRFYFRLALTGVALFALIAWAKVSVGALLAGLSIIVVNFLFWGLSRLAPKTRELPN